MPQNNELDGLITPTDAVFLVNRLEETAADPIFDVTGDGLINQLDVNAIMLHIGQTRNFNVDE